MRISANERRACDCRLPSVFTIPISENKPDQFFTLFLNMNGKRISSRLLWILERCVPVFHYLSEFFWLRGIPTVIPQRILLLYSVVIPDK